MVAVGVGVLAWVFIMAPYAHDRALSLGAQVVPIAYPARDLLLVAVVVRLLLGRGVRNTSFRLLAASVVALLVADGFFAVASLHNTYADGSPIDLGWLLSYALWGAAALHPSMSRLSEPSRSSEQRRGRFALPLLWVAALTPPATMLIEEVRGVSTDGVLLSLFSAVMFVLVLARLTLLKRALDASNDQLAQAVARWTVIAQTAVTFVGAADDDTLATAAVGAAVALAGNADSWSSFVELSPSGPIVAATAGPSPYRVGEPADSELTASWGERTPSVGPARLAVKEQDADHKVPCSPRFVAPVVVDDQVRGLLVVGYTGKAVDAFLPNLGLVSSQMSLALRSIKATEERHRAQNERQFQSLVQNSSDVVTLIGPDGIVRYQSPAVRAVLGREVDSLVGQSLEVLIHPEDASNARVQLTKVIVGGLAASANFECRIRHSDGSWRDMDTIITNLLDNPDVGAIVLNSRDITDRRALETELNRQAFHDPLTGLANRALFVDRVAHAMDRAERTAAPVAVLYLDIDDFKVVNDSLGHPAGDQLLVAFAERLKASSRPSDTVSRFGGDEFALLLESGDMPEAAQVAAGRIAEALKSPIHIGTEDISVRTSIGIAVDQPPYDGPDGLLRDADLAMYMAKRNGKGRFEMFRPAMHEVAVRRLELAADLRRGIEGGQLEVFYQPIVNAQTAMAIGAEALVRWHHPSRGLVEPIEFISVAESTGLIVPLGKWVLNGACRQAQSWRQSGVADDAFYISVNLSARQLQDPALLEDVARAIEDSGLPAEALVLEVTESVIMEDFDVAIARLQALKDLGLRLAVDDFGTGYSSLSYLRNLPVDAVKIDKSFVDRVALDPAGAAMVRSVIDLSVALGLTTIAEGVERPDQLAALNDLGCNSIQGYLFAKPMSNRLFADALMKLRTDAALHDQPVLSSLT
jgi:diguanylate cyclase (GGDEF)-like protein/PAS domain S-box-containing protein